jgi:hypothetical protein
MKIRCVVIQDKRRGPLAHQYKCDVTGESPCYSVVALYDDGEDKELFLHVELAKALAVSPYQFKRMLKITKR